MLSAGAGAGAASGCPWATGMCVGATFQGLCSTRLTIDRSGCPGNGAGRGRGGAGAGAQKRALADPPPNCQNGKSGKSTEHDGNNAPRCRDKA